MAGLALWVTDALELRPWVLFLTWVGYGLLGAGLTAGLRLIAGFTIGAAAGMATVILGAAWEPWTHGFAMPLALALSCGLLAALEKRPPLDTVPAYFLGMISFFATGEEPALALVWGLATPAALGIAWGWSTSKLRVKLEQRGGADLEASAAPSPSEETDEVKNSVAAARPAGSAPRAGATPA